MASPFSWPSGAKAAVSFTFDDARVSQIDHGMAVLDRAGVKATFYISPEHLEKRLDGWRRAVAQGHEIGNHSMTHPCSANFPWSRDKAVEDYTLERMERDEMLAANAFIEKTLGVKAGTYAYPCGHTYIGRGEATRSLVPLVAKHFTAGRGYRNEFTNDPVYCDLAHLGGVECDGASFDAMRAVLERARREGTWTIFVGHDIAPSPDFQVTVVAELEKTLGFLKENFKDFCVDTVLGVAGHIKSFKEGRS